jgi:uncharacterized protein (TIGR03437 family)
VKNLLAFLCLSVCLWGQASNAPSYTAAGVVNAASYQPALAPNTLASLFGTNLSWSTRGLVPADVAGGSLPMSLANVEVFIGWYQAHLLYVSPTQINFLIPGYLRSGQDVQLFVDRQGVHGPLVTVHLDPAAPALFEETAALLPAVTHQDGSLVTHDSPAAAGEIVSLWSTGLGSIYDPFAGCVNDGENDGVLPAVAAWLCSCMAPPAPPQCAIDQFSVWLNGAAVDPKLIWYAGVAPGYAGLYQVNLQLPDTMTSNPEIRLVIGEYKSPAGMVLPAR